MRLFHLDDHSGQFCSDGGGNWHVVQMMRRSYSRAGHFRYVPEGNGKLSASFKRVLLEEDLGVLEMYFRYWGIMTLHVLRSQSSTQQSVFH